MECNFFVGQKVTMITSDPWIMYSASERAPQFGIVYTIRDIVPEVGRFFLRFNEIRNPGGASEIDFAATSFRPVTDISDLRKIVAEVFTKKPQKVAA